MEDKDFLLEKNRLSTFKSWKFLSRHPCNARKMAEAGFFFIGSKKDPDLVKCFLCDKELNGWEKEDDPWKEHISHSPECHFAKLKTAEDQMSIKQWLTISQNFMEKCYEAYYDSLLSSVEENKKIIAVGYK